MGMYRVACFMLRLILFAQICMGIVWNLFFFVVYMKTGDTHNGAVMLGLSASIAFGVSFGCYIGGKLDGRHMLRQALGFGVWIVLFYLTFSRGGAEFYDLAGNAAATGIMYSKEHAETDILFALLAGGMLRDEILYYAERLRERVKKTIAKIKS
ncbi:hypothetical protein AGMMS49975_21360 [Clostridia bacterium]|nr:hypothetical protein AGMMS49975_21360 [Clostridia bacterium]GHU74152.1 hypothetical protein FACS1894188_01540 [Clostridia bacterium]